MKTKRFLVLAVILSMVMSCVGGISAGAVSTELHETYEVTDPEAAIPTVSADSFALTNGTIEKVTCTGMTKGEVYDSEKGKNVMKLSFNPKAEGTRSTTAPDVVASLDGFSALLKDGVANTISFDYKITGTSTGNVGIFLSDTMICDTGHNRLGAILANSGGMSVRSKCVTNRITTIENWNYYAQVCDKWHRQMDSDNRQWNRITFAVDSTGKIVTDTYLNGEWGADANKNSMITTGAPEGYGTLTNSNPSTPLEGEINSLLFNTAGAVDETQDLAVLIDNIRVYEGAPKLADTSAVASALTLVNDTSNTAFANMTDGYVMDPVKGAVRRVVFNKKTDKTDVRSGLTGFSPYMTDKNVNTISFDYKLSGSSKNNVGFFLNDYVGAPYGRQAYCSLLFNNTDGISVIESRANLNNNDWDAIASSASAGWKHVISNNREWNRLTLEIHYGTTETIKAYLNGKLFKELTPASNGQPLANMNSIFFNTKWLVGAGGYDANGSLSILFDNISAYPGKAKITDVDALEVINASGTEIDEFNAGESVYVKAGVTNNTSATQNYIVILAVYDGKGACVDVALRELKDVQVGKRGYIDGTDLGVTLPKEAATVKAFLWSNWNSITPICDFDTATVATE